MPESDDKKEKNIYIYILVYSNKNEVFLAISCHVLLEA